MMEFRVFTADNLPNLIEQQVIVSLANMLDDAMLAYSQSAFGDKVAKPIAYKVENFKADFFSIQKTAITVIIVDSTPVGYCWWVGDENYASIYNFYILDSCQRKGYGTALMQNVMSSVKERNPDNSTLGLDTLPNNIVAHNFYKKQGFFVDCISFRHNF